MSNFLLALLIGGSAGAWFYFQLSKHSIARSGPNLVGAAIGGLFVFIVVLSLAAKFIS